MKSIHVRLEFERLVTELDLIDLHERCNDSFFFFISNPQALYANTRCFLLGHGRMRRSACDARPQRVVPSVLLLGHDAEHSVFSQGFLLLSSFTSCSEASTTVRRDAVIPAVSGSSAVVPAAGNANHGGSVHAVSRGLTTFRSGVQQPRSSAVMWCATHVTWMM